MKIVCNLGDDELPASVNPQSVVGCVNQVTDTDAKEVLGIVLWQEDLIQLVKYWMDRILAMRFFHFVTGCYSGSDFRIINTGEFRIARISELIGDEPVKAAVDEVYKKHHDDNPRDWAVFLKGDPAQKAAYCEEFERHLSGECTESCTKRFREDGSLLEHHAVKDWEWIDQETERHHRGECSMGSRTEFKSGIFRNGSWDHLS